MDKKYVVPTPGMIINEDVSFLPGIYNFFEKEGIRIESNNITIEGNGAVFIGGKKKERLGDTSNKNEFSYGYTNKGKDDRLGYHGIGFYSIGTKNVTIKNLSAKNFEVGLKLVDCSGWSILNNDFSYNYHNPDHGWEEHDDLGGIVLYGSNDCKLEKNRANNVWSGLVIKNGCRNLVKDNDFSHTSNVGLRLWASCSNEFYNNNFSWGLRKEPYEIHARDSASVLIETGSNDNRFIKNDMRFGGDGLFIRSLNGWMSTGNYFEENDTSFANNNAIEAWDEGNSYVRNKANFSSYGFWLGNSDNTLLLENEVCYNGVNFKNAPENFGNAGISVVNGSGTNFKMIRNKIHNNNGPGVAIRNRVDYPSTNWIIEENEIFDNRTDARGFIGHGIYLKYARGISLINNNIHGNDGEAVCFDEYVGDVRELHRTSKPLDIDIKIKANSKTFLTGKFYTFEAISTQSNLEYHWEFGDGVPPKVGPKRGTVNKCFDSPGFYRVILSVTDGENVNYDCINIFVLQEGMEVATDSKLSDWVLTGDKDTKLTMNEINYVSGSSSLLLESGKGKDITLQYPLRRALRLNASEYTHFSFCVRFMKETIEWYKDNKTPTIRFYRDKGNYAEFIPRPNLFGDIANQYNESKYEWAYIEMDLNNDVDFIKKVNGEFDFKEVNYMEFYIDTPMDSHIIFMLDGMRFIKRQKNLFVNIVDISKHLNDKGIDNKVIVSSNNPRSSVLAPLSKNVYFGDYTKRWISSDNEGMEFYEIDLGGTRRFNRVVVDFYNSISSTLNSNNERLPEKLTIEYFADDKWKQICCGNKEIANSPNIINFDSVMGSKIRFVMEGVEKPFSIYNIELNNTLNKLTEDNVYELRTENKCCVDIDKIGVKLNCALSETGSKLSPLVVSLNEYKGNVLNSKLLFEKEINIDEIMFKKETIFDVGLKCLDWSKKYYLALTQKALAEDLIVGQYYRWVGRGIADMDSTYGYINGNEVVDSNKVGWGSNWMKVYTNKYILDLSHTNDTLGNRFGLNSMEKIYQKFELKNPALSLVECSISDLRGVAIEGSERVIIKLAKALDAEKIILYFHEETSLEVEVKVSDEEYKGEVHGSTCEIKIGKELVEFEISIVGKGVLRAIEIQ
ncbi:MAG: hypothetical protein K0R09_2513 [Clostridiales bacterium]|jgi:parallel beta-helix repeat protein|nr:hypothetical protein [Clostridiales bacterium]